MYGKVLLNYKTLGSIVELDIEEGENWRWQVHLDGPDGYKVDGLKGHTTRNWLLGGLEEALNGNNLQITTNPSSSKS